MSTRVVDRYGSPYATREVRQRMGFLAGELDAEGSEPPTFVQPGGFDINRVRQTSEDGGNDDPVGRS